MSPPRCQKMSAKPCNRNAEESFPVLSLKSREQKPPNPLLIQDKNVLQPSLVPLAEALYGPQSREWYAASILLLIELLRAAIEKNDLSNAVYKSTAIPGARENPVTKALSRFDFRKHLRENSPLTGDRKSTRLNSSHMSNSYA